MFVEKLERTDLETFGKDYLNLKHEFYFDATTNEQIGNFSFIDLLLR